MAREPVCLPATAEADDCSDRFDACIDPDARPGDVLRPLAALLRNLRDRERAASAPRAAAPARPRGRGDAEKG
jgi:hypothetical protein